MMQIKVNYRNKYTNIICRWCNEDEETQIHILKYYPEFKQLTNNQNEMYYHDDNESTSVTKKK